MVTSVVENLKIEQWNESSITSSISNSLNDVNDIMKNIY